MLSQSLNPEFASAYEVYTDEKHKLLEKVVCLRCGRPLTNEKSRLARLGPKCARKIAYEMRTQSFSLKTLKHYYQSFFNSQSSNCLPLSAKHLSLYYIPNSRQKPSCKIGTFTLSSLDFAVKGGYKYRKRLFFLPLIEGIVYQIFELLPKPRIFCLQVQNQKLIDVGSSKFVLL